MIFDALILNVSLSYFIFLFYLTPAEDAKIFLSLFNNEAVDEEIWSSKLTNFKFPELAIEPRRPVVAREFTDYLKSFFFIFIES